VGPLTPRHGASLGCGWKTRPSVLEAAANILNNQSWTADKGWFSRLGVGRGTKELAVKNKLVTKIKKRPGSGRILINDLS
jgi:hypothetical protein